MTAPSGPRAEMLWLSMELVRPRVEPGALGPRWWSLRSDDVEQRHAERRTAISSPQPAQRIVLFSSKTVGISMP